MIIVKKDVLEYKKAQEKEFKYSTLISSMSRERWKLTSMPIDKYIYIHDHYEYLLKFFEIDK